MMAFCVFLTGFSVRRVIPKISLGPHIKKTTGQWRTSISFAVLNEHKEIIEIYLPVTQPPQSPIALLSWNIKKMQDSMTFHQSSAAQIQKKKGQHRVSKMAQEDDGSVVKSGNSIQ